MKRNLATLLLLALLVGLPPLGAGYFHLARAQKTQAQQPAEASKSYEKAARLLPWQPNLREQAGLAAFQAGENQRAMQILMVEKQRDALTPEGLLALGELYWQQGDAEAAYTEAWLPLSETGFTSSQLAARLAAYAESKRDYPAAVSHLRQVIQFEPGNAPAHYRLGLLLAAENPAQALSSLEKAVALDTTLEPSVKILRAALTQALAQPDLAYQNLVIGRALASLGEWTLASKAFATATQANPNYAEAWAWQAEALYQLGAAPANEIEQSFEKALALNPTSAGIQVMAGLYWQRQRDYPRAEALYTRATELEPDNPAWWQALAGVIAQRDLPLALDYHLKATEIAPYQFSTWYALAAFCVDNEAFLNDYGLAAALRAYALEPDNPQAMDLLGRALALTGEIDSAQIIYEKALAAAPEAAAPRFHLALLYLQMNLRPEAKVMFQETLRLDPDGPYGAQAGNILDRYFP